MKKRTAPRSDRDSLERRAERARTCFDQLCPPDERTRRAAVTADALRQLVDYRTYLEAVDSERAMDCAGLRGQLEDRAFAAEDNFRILLAECLRSVNDLRDSGMLHAGLSEFARQLGGGNEDLSRMLRETREELGREKPAVPHEFYDEALAQVEKRLVGLDYESDTDSLVVRRKSLDDGEPSEVRVRLSPQQGDIARVGIGQFFGASDLVGVDGVLTIAPPSDCHERASGRADMETDQSIDAYAGVLGAMGSAREAMYRHARKVTQYGHGNTVRAEDPITIAVIAIVAGFASLIASALSGGPVSPTSWGAIFLYIGIIAIGAAIIIGILFL